MTEQTADSLLMGGGATFFSTSRQNALGQWVTKPYGQTGRTVIAGTVANIGEIQQQTDFNTGALLTWTDGKARQQFPITIDVDWQNTIDWDLQNGQWVQVGPADADDKQRGIMIKQSSDLQGKLREAIKGSGATGLQLGAYITVELVGEVPGQGNPRKDHRVTYAPPAQGVMMDGGQTQQTQYDPNAQSAQIAANVQGQGAPQAQVPPQNVPQQFQQGGYVQPQPKAQQPAQQSAQGYAPGQQTPVQPVAQQAPPPAQQPQQQAPQQQQAAPQGNAQDPWVIAKKLLHELHLPPEQVAATTGLTVEQVQQIPPF